MKPSFEEVMSKESDAELLKIVNEQRDDCQPAAVEAAERELAKRKSQEQTNTVSQTMEQKKQVVEAKAQEPVVASVKNNANFGRWFVIIGLIIIGAILPFHYIPSRLMVFPKDNLTFSNTFITQKDIDKLVDRYNQASFFQKQAINQEPFVRKLMEKGIIVEVK